MATPSLKEKTAHGLLWGGLSNGVQQVLNLLFGIFLARMLTPDDYGMVGMLLIFSQLATALQESGFTAALVNQKEIYHDDYNAVFWFSISVSVGMYLILFFCAPLIANFYDTPELVSLARYQFIGIVLSALGIAQSAFLFKTLQVKQRAIALMVGHVISGIVGVFMAWAGFAYWGIATQNLTYIGVITAIYWYYSPWRPTFHINLAPIKRMIGFGGKLLITRILNRVNDNILTVILGRYYTTNDVGFYNQAYKWSSMGGYMITGMTSSVALPVLAEVANEKERQKQVFKKMLGFVAFISFPVMFGLGFIAEELICITITDKWLSSVPLMQMLCISGAFVPMTVLCQQLFVSRGKADIYMWNIILSGIAITIGCLLASPYGIHGMVCIYVGIYIAWFFIWLSFVWKEINLTLAKACIEIFPFALTAIVAMEAVQLLTKDIDNIYYTICLKITLSAILYVGILWMTKATMLRESINYLLHKKIEKDS